jgi:hypothetical protein
LATNKKDGGSRSEILLLSPNLLNPSHGDESLDESMTNGANPKNFGARNNDMQTTTGRNKSRHCYQS